jgi:precorrin-2 dehydrogenase/sirohydrochlorin ferrochelatase
MNMPSTSGAGLALFVELEGALCVCIGGGNVAARRVASLLRARAQIRVIAPHVMPEIAALASAPSLELVPRAYQDGDVQGARLVVVATNNREVDERVARDALAAGALTVVAGAPELGNCHFMAMVRRGRLEVGIHTGGLSPAVTAAVRRRLENVLPVGLEPGLAAVGELRAKLHERIADAEERQRRWREAVDAGAIERLLDGDTDLALNILRYTLLQE